MLLVNHIFKLLIAFITGILFAWSFDVHWVIYFTVWSTILVSLLVTIHFGRKVIHFRKTIAIQLLLVFLLSGAFSYQYSLPKSQRKHFTKYYLKNDVLQVKVLEAERDTSGYRKMIFEVKAVGNEHNSKSCLGKILGYVDSPNNVGVGDILFIQPRVQKIQNTGNPGAFDAEKFWGSKGIRYMCFVQDGKLKKIREGSFTDRFWIKAREALRSVVDEHLSSENRSVANALVLGDKSDLSNNQKENFTEAGAMHVLAVSGMHVGILLGFLQWIFYRISFLRKRGLFIISALVVVWCFAFLTGLSSSVFRATIMFSVLAIGQLRGYSFFSLNALFVSAIIILFIDPLSLFNIGFQLSFLAMLGISFFFNPIKNLINSKYKILNFFWDGTALGIAAQIGTIPISLYYFHQFPNYFILTNLGLIILAACALIALIILFMVFWIPWLSDVIGTIVDIVFTVLNGFIEWINSLPATISKGFDPSLWWVITVYVLVISTLIFWRRQKLRLFYGGVSALMLMGFWLISQRELNYYREELIFLNMQSPTLMIKEKGHAIIIFQKEKSTKEDLQFIANGAEKETGVQVECLPINSHHVYSSGEKIKVRSLDSKFLIDYHGQQIVFTNSLNRSNQEDSFIVGNQISEGPDINLTTKGGSVSVVPNDKRF
tara:strand:+ start:63214 stop:65187 length:1974 start_codon:yes stop_codon:yes gene_type:complete